MVSAKILVTGTTGYVGGDIFHALYEAHPEYEYSVLVRSKDKGEKIAAAYPRVRIVYGSLDDAELVQREAEAADVVLHAADADNLTAGNAIAKGLAKTHTASKPGFWLHLSGTGVLAWADIASKRFGEAPNSEAYNDLDSVSALTSLPDDAWHRAGDKVVLAAASPAVKTAIICPPTIYGTGRGQGNQRSVQLNGMIQLAFKNGITPIAGKGLTQWDNIHVSDVASLFVLLVEQAVTWTPAAPHDADIWGPNGYFLASNAAPHVWGEISRVVAQKAHAKGYIPTAETQTITADEASQQGGPVALTWGLNSAGRAGRAAKFLGWTPQGPSFVATVDEVMEREAKEYGLLK